MSLGGDFIKKQIILLAVLILVLILALEGCSPNSANKVKEKAPVNTEQGVDKQPTQGIVTQETAMEGQSEQQPVTSEDVLKEMTNEEKSWMGLTTKQYLKDFDFLYEELQNNYPYFGVAWRKYNVNIADLYAGYRKQLTGCKNDEEFFAKLKAFMSELQYTGHIQLWGYSYSSRLAELEETVKAFPQYEETLARYIKKLENPVSQKNYELMQEFYTKLDAEVDKRNQEKGITEDSDTDWQETEEIQNVTTKILEKNKIAYVNINAFDMNTYEQDNKTLLAFYKEVQNYDHLILDITENSGGGMDYFNQLVVAPLTNKTHSVSTFLLTKAGKNNEYFLNLKEGLEEGLWLPVSQLPELGDVNKEDLSQMDYFMKETYLIKPNHQSEFNGKIWLLVSPRNYSSSEYAAMFSKQSGFATLVGEKTGGDGIGVDPTYIILPNSGLVVQYSPIYGITADGRNSEEYGTEPDYYRQKDKTALETCLELIKKNSTP